MDRKTVLNWLLPVFILAIIAVFNACNSQKDRKIIFVLENAYKLEAGSKIVYKGLSIGHISNFSVNSNGRIIVIGFLKKNLKFDTTAKVRLKQILMGDSEVEIFYPKDYFPIGNLKNADTIYADLSASDTSIESKLLDVLIKNLQNVDSLYKNGELKIDSLNNGYPLGNY